MRDVWPLLSHLTRIFILTMLILAGTISMTLIFWPQYFRGRSSDYTIYSYQKIQMSRQTGMNNVVIGDSRGNCHFDPRRFGESWLNLSLPGSTPMEGFVTLEKYLNAGNKADTLVIVYGIDHLRSRNLGFFENLAIPHRLMDPYQLKELEDFENQNGAMFQRGDHISAMGLGYRQLARRLKYMRFPLAYHSNFSRGVRDMTVDRERTDGRSESLKKSLPSTRGFMLFGIDSSYDKPMRIRPGSQYDLNPFSRHYLGRIFELSRRHGTKVFLIVPPLNEATFAYPHAVAFLNQAHLHLENLTSSYPHVRLVTRPAALPNDCFGDDNWHFNKRGVNLYSRTLWNEVFMREGSPVVPPDPPL